MMSDPTAVLQAARHGDDPARALAQVFSPSTLELRRLSSRDSERLQAWLIRHEAVHPIADADDLRARLDPDDRRCFGLVHPDLPDEPVAFTEVALTREPPTRVGDLLDSPRTRIPAHEASIAVPYSISACHPQLRGLALGALLLRRAVAALRADLPNLRDVVTLSPVPGLRDWVEALATRAPADPAGPGLQVTEDLVTIAESLWNDRAVDHDDLRRLVTTFVLRARDHANAPVDPVARFHLGNGATLDRVVIGADRSTTRVRQSFGVMVGYRYERRSA